MNINDIFISSGEEGNGNMDLPYDNAELMSSEFFDSVLSLQNDLEDGFLSNFEDENNMSSDEVPSPQSYYSESDKHSTYSTSENNTDTESSAMLNSIDGLDDPLLLSFLDTITQPEIKQEPVVKSPAPIETLPSVPKATRILIQNPSNKKFIAKPITNATQLRKPISKVKPQILKVQQVTNNGTPVLLPLSFKSIKILNTAADVASLTNQHKKRKIESVKPICEEETERIQANNQYPPLTLSNEEKRLLAKEGIQLPTHYPLTKNEERELKRIRRKIRNKISAQDSRKRKKEYVDGLEERVKRGSEENKNLLQRVRELQRQNRTLIAHVNRLQALICKSSSSKATPSTCLMVVLLSALLVSLPNMKLFENKQMSTVGEQLSIRRSLLSDLQATAEDDLNMEEFLIFKDDDEPEAKFGDDVQVENSTEKEFAKMLSNVGKKYGDDHNENDGKHFLKRMMDTMKNLFSNQNVEGLDIKPSFGGSYNKRGFIEPDIDDYYPGDEAPPLKRARVISDYEVGSTTNIGNEAIISSTVTKDK